MDTSRPPASADDEQQQPAPAQPTTRMTSNHPHANSFAYPESAYHHQKPPSFNHKHVNISLVDDGSGNAKKQPSKANKEKQASAEWRDSIPIKLEHLLFNFKENSLKVYKASPPRIMQIIALLVALLLFCGVLALVLSQRDDHSKKEANLPLDQSAVAERIIGESQLLSNKLKNSLFEFEKQKNQTNEKSRNKFKSDASKDAAVRKAFGSLLFSGDDNDEVEPDPEENNSDESFDGERSRSRNFNLFLSENGGGGNERGAADEKEKNAEQSENPRVMFIERLMGLHFGVQPKFGLSESLVIRKTIAPGDESTAADEPANKEPEMDFLLNSRANSNRNLSSKSKEPKNDDPTPFLRYAAAAMLSRVLAAAQQQAYIQQLQQQQRFREMNEKSMFNSPYRGYRMMREPTPEASYMREPSMYGRPMHHPKHHPSAAGGRPMLPFQSPAAAAGNQFVSDRGFSRGPLLSNEEAESQQIHPIILMLNLPYKDQGPAGTGGAQLMLMGQAPSQSTFAHPVETAIQPIFMPMPYAATSSPRQNPYYKQTRDQQPAYSSPFAHHKSQHQHYYPQPHATAEGYYAPVSGGAAAAAHQPHPYGQTMMQPMSGGHSNYRPAAVPPPQRYQHRITNTIEVPIEIHHQVSPSVSPAAAAAQGAQAQIIVQPQIEPQSQPNESGDQDQSGENEHHMVVFYSDADNINHSEENASGPAGQPQQPSVEATSTGPQQQQQLQQPQQPQQPPQQPPVFVKESKQINNDLEKANHQISKMLLLHFVNNQDGVQLAPPSPPEQQPKSFSLIQPEQPEKAQPAPNSNKMEETAASQKMSLGRPQPREALRNEEETSTGPNDQANREEAYEPNNERDDAEPASLAQFAQVIRHVIDQQQQSQEQQQQAPPMRPAIIAQPPQATSAPISAVQAAAAPAQQPQQQQAPNMPVNSFQPVPFPPRKEQQVENSNKETEKPQESIQTPAFMLMSDDEN